MRIVLFGASGRLGWELRRSLAPLGELVVPSRTDPGGDLTRPDEVSRHLRRIVPQVIVNAAAWTAVDRAEDEPALAWQLNAAAPALLAAEALRLGAWLVHYSTDYVFDGSGGTPWREADAARPLGAYGRSKAQGDAAILASGCRSLILRTGWMHAVRGANFARTILQLAHEREVLSVVDDQWGAPTGADLVADITAQALPAAWHAPALAGLYHVAAAGAVSRCGYARHVLAEARLRGMTLRAGPDAIRPVSSDSFAARAPRPRNSRLDTAKLRAAFGLFLPPWQDGVSRLLAELPDSGIQ